MSMGVSYDQLLERFQRTWLEELRWAVSLLKGGPR